MHAEEELIKNGELRIMKNRVYIIVLMSVMAVCGHAQSFPSSEMDNNAIQSQQILPTNTYNGTVYEPFDNSAPSEQSAVGSDYSPAKAPSGPRRGFIGGPESGQGPSPIGDAMLPLLLMAIVFAAGVSVKKLKGERKLDA